MSKEAIHERDRQRCTNCLALRETVKTFDVDHNVPRGVGGSELYQNKQTLCRRCHDAKHGDGIAPTVQLESSGRMTGVEFRWFRHFVKEMLPKLAEEHGIELEPKFNLDDGEAWHLPLGDFRRLDRQLSKEDGSYRSLQASDYM